MNKPIIWLDCDGVLLDWTRPFLAYSGLNVRYEDLTDIDLTKHYDKPEDFYDIMHKYHKSQVFHCLPNLVEKDALKLLRLRTGCQINVITQIENNVHVRDARLMNLYTAFGNAFDRVVFTVRGECKLKKILSEQPNDKHIIVEDNPATLGRIADYMEDRMVSYGQTDVTAIGIVHPYNLLALSDIPYIYKTDSTESALAHAAWYATQVSHE